MTRWFHIITIVLITIIAVMVGNLYYSFEEENIHIRENINSLFVREAHNLSRNVVRWLNQRISGDLYETLRHDSKLRAMLERDLSILVTPTYRYVYLLRRDKEGKYRFLLDGSIDADERADFDEVLQVDHKVWDRVYYLHRCETIVQSHWEEISMTHLAPFTHQGKVAGVIAIDFSPKIKSSISEAMLPALRMTRYVFWVILLLVLIMLSEATYLYWNMKQRFIDGLTQIYNRAYLREFIAQHRLEEYSVAMLDIDHFKRINDTYGHKMGDVVLQTVVKIVQEKLRSEDILIRFGGEEFLLFIYRKKMDNSHIRSIVERLRKAVATHSFEVDTHKIRVTISVGLVFEPQRYRHFSEAIKEADMLLYMAKRTGRNKVVSEIDQIEGAHTEQYGVDEVRSAIDEERIVCYYQPIVNLETMEVIEYEALVRLRTRDGKIVAPIQFLPAIERTSTYGAMTRYMLEHIFQTIETKGVSVSVNLNSSDLIDTTIFEQIVIKVADYRHLAGHLVVEILENEPYEPATMNDRIAQLKQLGVQLAIDDFGSGYANFSLITEAPIDIVKIDGSLVKDIVRNRQKENIIKAIVQMAHELDLLVVAEYIADREIFERIKALGVDAGQGYYLGKPDITPHFTPPQA